MREKFTEEYIIREAKKQFKKHPHCMDSTIKWKSYKDKPFCVTFIQNHIGWRRLKNALGLQCGKYSGGLRNSYSDHTKIISDIAGQLKKHPDCMDSDKKWRLYKDQPFSADFIQSTVGWNKAKVALGLKSRPQGFSEEAVIVGIKEQYKKYPDCMGGTNKWDSYKDKPFSSATINKYIGWEKANEVVGLKYQKKGAHTEQDILDGVEAQLKKHPDCMATMPKWDSYKDKPFSSATINNIVGWNKTKKTLGVKLSRNRNLTKQEAFAGIKSQLKKHPDCMDSQKKWDSYKDKPFSVNVIISKIGWQKAKKELGLACIQNVYNPPLPYTNKEILEIIRTKLEEDPTCMNSQNKWDALPNRPFAARTACERFNCAWYEFLHLIENQYNLTKEDFKI